MTWTPLYEMWKQQLQREVACAELVAQYDAEFMRAWRGEPFDWAAFAQRWKKRFERLRSSVGRAATL